MEWAGCIEMPTANILKSFQVIVLTLIAFLGCLTIRRSFNPPFTDSEIQASIVDTWQSEAFATLMFLIIVAVVAILSFILAVIHSNNLVRRIATVTVLVTCIVGAIGLHNHAMLTRRTTELTGQAFDRFYGLF